MIMSQTNQTISQGRKKGIIYLVNFPIEMDSIIKADADKNNISEYRMLERIIKAHYITERRNKD